MCEDTEQPRTVLLPDGTDDPTGIGDQPPDVSRRAEDYVSSRHSRLIDEIRQPLEINDPREAVARCATHTRTCRTRYGITAAATASPIATWANSRSCENRENAAR